MASFKIKALLVILLVNVCTQHQVQAATRMDYIFWTRSTDQFVSVGSESYLQEVHFISPCAILTRFNHILLTQPHVVKNALGNAIMPKLTNRGKRQLFRASSNYTNNNIVPGSSNNLQPITGIELAVQRCNYYFEREFSDSVGKFFINHQRKQLLMGIAGGLILSNIVSSAEERLLGHQDDVEKFHTIARKLNLLNEQFNLNKMLSDISAAKIKDLASWVNRLSDTMSEFQAHSPELSVVTSYLIHKIVQKSEQINRLYISMEQSRPDFITLGEILHTARFGRLHPASVKIGGVVAMSSTYLRITLHGQVRAPGVDVFRVHSFSHFVRNGTRKFRREYSGKSLIVYNRTCDCTRAAEMTTQTVIETICDQASFVDPRLKEWRDVPIKSELEVPTQYIDSYPWTIIYCFPRNVTIVTDNVSREKVCPIKPFQLPQNQTFRTSDGVLNHKAVVRNIFVEPLVEMKLDVAEIHFDHPFDESATAWQAYDQLVNESRALSAQNTAIEIGSFAFSWMHLFYMVLAIVALCLALNVLVRCYCRFLANPDDQDFIRNVRRRSHPGIYAMAMGRLRSRAETSATHSCA